MSAIAKTVTNTEKNVEKDLTTYKSLLQGVGILEFLRAAAYGVSAVLVMTMSNSAEIARKVFNITEGASGLSAQALACGTGVIITIISLIMGILIFKALKPGSKAALVVEILAWISLLTTVIYQITSSDGYNISYSISNLIDCFTITSAAFLRRNNHA